MNERVKRISEQAKALTASELEALVDELLACLHVADPEADKAWKTEINRRLEEVRKGEVETLHADQVMADLRARLAANRSGGPKV